MKRVRAVLTETMSEHEDQQVGQWLEQAISGDQSALERLLLRHHARLTAFLARKLPVHLRSLISVEDILQDTYVVVFREIGDFKPHSPRAFFHWICRIAEHRLYDAVRAEHAAKRGGDRRRIDVQTTTPTGSVVEWLEQLAMHERTPSQSVARKEAIGVVRGALDGLPEDYREALRLRYLDGLSVAQTAERMSRTQGAVCLLCHRAIKKLHVALGSSTEFLGLKE